MRKVEFRFLQVIVSHVTGDRVTLGLIHWDGETCRSAQSFAHLDFCEPEQRSLIKQTAAAKLRRGKRALDTAAKRDSTGFLLGLADLFPVREGYGASMYWSPVESSITQDPAAHFEALRAQTRLKERPKSESATVTNHELSQQLLAKLNELQEEAPDRVLLQNEVKHLQSFIAPVSWKNGRWHHAIPCSLDVADEAGMAKRVRDLVGLVQLCIPPGDVPVPILVYPVSPMLAKAAQAEAKIAEEGLAQRDVSMIAVGRAGDRLALDEVVERVHTNIASIH